MSEVARLPSGHVRINDFACENTLCGHVDFGNGTLCDECWWSDCLESDREAIGAYARSERAKPARAKPVPPRQEALF